MFLLSIAKAHVQCLPSQHHIAINRELTDAVGYFTLMPVKINLINNI